ncbi:hypothetical protein [Herbiconiux sp. L3-i23]|uniref:hypothetical protein n=1 Tax=Herbiconiux sp. L3-i23 TaxID=2905871 RepID=UPI0020455551|nr:hypothetical protein [Herbiconiux sp. L3-i23]BDI22575.1 hypothetical protein L3i23_13510 [Herbiconiux sp. L3-i23]
MQQTPETATGRRIDLAALHSRVTLSDVSRYYRAHRVPASRQWWLIALIVGGYLIGQAVLVNIYLPLAGLGPEANRSVYGVILIATGAYALFLMWLIWRNASRQVRLDRTAAANGLEYADRSAIYGSGGSALDILHNRMTADMISSPPQAGGVEFDAGTFGPIPGFTLRRMGFVRLRLDREVPHIVLLNRRSRVLRTTGSRFLQTQRLRLEGDFDRTFSLFCPEGYERDALYLFTPDLMALLLDVASDCEVELVGSRLVLYRGSPWKLWRPRRFASVLALVDALAPKVQRQTSRYQDDHADAYRQVVASAGRRLRVRPSAGTILSMAFPIVSMAVGLLAWLGIL